MFNAPPHTPRHPLQDRLYYALHDYRTARAIGLRYQRRDSRRRALAIIAEIKGRAK
jgi:hypothetical protein